MIQLSTSRHVSNLHPNRILSRRYISKFPARIITGPSLRLIQERKRAKRIVDDAPENTPKTTGGALKSEQAGDELAQKLRSLKNINNNKEINKDESSNDKSTSSTLTNESHQILTRSNLFSRTSRIAIHSTLR